MHDHWTGRFSCLIPAVCILCYRCRSLQSCRLYWSQCVDHLREFQDHRSRQLDVIHETVFEEYEQDPIYEYNQLRMTAVLLNFNTFSVQTNFQAYTHIHKIISMQFKQPLLIPNMHVHHC